MLSSGMPPAGLTTFRLTLESLGQITEVWLWWAPYWWDLLTTHLGPGPIPACASDKGGVAGTARLSRLVTTCSWDRLHPPGVLLSTCLSITQDADSHRFLPVASISWRYFERCNSYNFFVVNLPQRDF